MTAPPVVVGAVRSDRLLFASQGGNFMDSRKTVLKMIGRLAGSMRRCAPLLLLFAFCSVQCFAMTSPFGKWLNDLSTEAVTQWAFALASIGIIVGLVGAYFSEHEWKGKFVTVAVISFILLNVDLFIAYFRSEA